MGNAAIAENISSSFLPANHCFSIASYSMVHSAFSCKTNSSAIRAALQTSTN